MTITDTAMELAIVAHHGHENKHDGEPYLLHVQRVAVAVREAGWSEVFQAVAWLHDAYEDFPDRMPLTRIHTAFSSFGDIVADLITSGVEAISHKPGESNDEYLHRCKRNTHSAVVKPFDRDDNFRRLYLIEDDAKRARMSQKYSMSLAILGPSRRAGVTASRGELAESKI